MGALLILAWLIQALAPVSAAFAMRAVTPIEGAILCVTIVDDDARVTPAPSDPIKKHIDCPLCQAAHASFVSGPEPDFSVVARQRAFETVAWTMARAYRPALALNDQSRSRAPPAC